MGRPAAEVDRDTFVKSFDKLAMTSPERAAATIVRGIQRGSRRVLVGPDAFVFDRLQRLAPVRYPKLLARLVPERER